MHSRWMYSAHFTHLAEEEEEDVVAVVVPVTSLLRSTSTDWRSAEVALPLRAATTSWEGETRVVPDAEERSILTAYSGCLLFFLLIGKIQLYFQPSTHFDDLKKKVIVIFSSTLRPVKFSTIIL